MNHARATNRRHRESALTLPPRFLLLSRLVLSLSGLLLLLMPWTERFCTWDLFLRGGDDLELGLLATTALLSLVLLLAEHRRGVFTELAALTGSLSLPFRIPATLTHAGHTRAVTLFAPERLNDILRSISPQPLRV